MKVDPIDHKELTPEQMILQTAPRHELIHKKPLFILQAVSEELYEVRVRQKTQVINLRLQDSRTPLVECQSIPKFAEEKEHR